MRVIETRLSIVGDSDLHSDIVFFGVVVGW
jgi:hypothetical protein